MLVSRHRNLFTSLVRLTAVATAMLMLTVLIVTHSEAAFSDTTDNTANSFSTGSVVLTDDDGGSTAMYVGASMTPGVPVVECVTLTYSGSLVPADIRMYGTSGGALAPYLDTTIEVGSGGSFGNCAGFVPGGPAIYSGTLSGFSAAHTNWATGLATFTAPANPTSQTLRFTIDVQNDPLAQAKAATADFTWEAQD